ncbi:hypothetical protein STEG23_014506, partial [Scotinomys teguina]
MDAHSELGLWTVESILGEEADKALATTCFITAIETITKMGVVFGNPFMPFTTMIAPEFLTFEILELLAKNKNAKCEASTDPPSATRCRVGAIVMSKCKRNGRKREVGQFMYCVFPQQMDEKGGLQTAHKELKIITAYLPFCHIYKIWYFPTGLSKKAHFHSGTMAVCLYVPGVNGSDSWANFREP